MSGAGKESPRDFDSSVGTRSEASVYVTHNFLDNIRETVVPLWILFPRRYLCLKGAAK